MNKQDLYWKSLLIVLVLLLPFLSSGQKKPVSAETDVKQQILEIEEKQVALVRTNDFKGLAEWLARTLTDKCTVVHGNGDLVDKTNAVKEVSAMAGIQDPNLLYETFTHVEQNVEIYGDAAIFSARALSRSQPAAKAGRPAIESRLTHFFVKQNGEWKIARIHMTHLPIK